MPWSPLQRLIVVVRQRVAQITGVECARTVKAGQAERKSDGLRIHRGCCAVSSPKGLLTVCDGASVMTFYNVQKSMYLRRVPRLIRISLSSMRF